jgi:hypothetical protein
VARTARSLVSEKRTLPEPGNTVIGQPAFPWTFRIVHHMLTPVLGQEALQQAHIGPSLGAASGWRYEPQRESEFRIVRHTADSESASNRGFVGYVRDKYLILNYFS